MNYELKDNTYLAKPKDDPRDRIEIEIGDSKQPDFKCQAKIKRWDNEVNLSYRLIDNEIGTEKVSTQNDKIVWEKGNKIVNFYELPISEEHPEGAYEFDITLKSKPATNKIEFSLNTKGVDFLYQPELTQKEKDEGANRPENVVGSYAVYASENKINYKGGKLYKAGKVGHIFRPKIVDNAGNWTWGILNIDKEKGILSVEIPQEFLDNAVYPVRHSAGLTFGYTTAGGTLATFSANPICILKNDLTSSAGDTITKFSVYAKSANSSIGEMGAYTQESDLPVSRLAAGSGITINSSTPQWWNTATVSQAMTAGIIYNIAWVWLSGDSSGASGIYYDTGTGAERSFHNIQEALPITWINGGTSATRYSIYATYTAGGGSAIKTINGLAKASVKTVNGLAIASVKTWDGLA